MVIDLAAPVRSEPTALRDFLAIAAEGASLHSAERGKTLCQAKEPSDFVTLLESGLCAAVKATPEGHQQTVALYVPGDIVDHEALTLGVLRSSIVALAPTTFYRLPRARLRNLLSDDPRFAVAFCNYVAFQGALAHEWLLSMGRRPALPRTAHLLCEVVHRMHSAGMGSATTCTFPLTQTELADVLGLSVVHINRTLQRLRQESYIALRRGTLEILQWSELASLAGFDTSYLEHPVGA